MYARWLQYHDRDTGNLLGTLPLALGLRVALTDHIDRSPDKQLLRGQVGVVHSWVWEENAPRPSVVYVKFEGAAWKLDGITEAGVYPIVPQNAQWYLDKKRKHKVLKVTRTQLPLTPAYAMTAHSSQGKTLRAVLLDLSVDKMVDPTIGTVAATRVRSREDVLILRPFQPWLFQRPASDGPDLLLRKLRGEEIDWAAWREAKRPCSTCVQCRQVLPMDCFHAEQWDLVRTNGAGLCKSCKLGIPNPRRRTLEPDSLQKYKCFGCNTLKIAEAFPRAQLQAKDAQTSRLCLKCVQTSRTQMQCCRCSETKPQDAFQPCMVTMPADAFLCRACQSCIEQKGNRTWRGFFKCMKCSQLFPSAAVGYDEGRRCLNCATRSTNQKVMGQQTCRNNHCKRQWQEETKSAKRQRYCPQCRRR